MPTAKQWHTVAGVYEQAAELVKEAHQKHPDDAIQALAKAIVDLEIQARLCRLLATKSNAGPCCMAAVHGQACGCRA